MRLSDAVAFGDQHVHVQAHADTPAKAISATASQQAAVAAVVVGQDLALARRRSRR